MNRQTGIVVGVLSVAVLVLVVVVAVLAMKPTQVVEHRITVPGMETDDRKANISRLDTYERHEAAFHTGKNAKIIAELRAKLGLKPGDPIPAD